MKRRLLNDYGYLKTWVVITGGTLGFAMVIFIMGLITWEVIN